MTKMVTAAVEGGRVETLHSHEEELLDTHMYTAGDSAAAPGSFNVSLYYAMGSPEIPKNVLYRFIVRSQ